MNRRLLGACLFAIAFAVYVASPVMTSWDSRWSIHTAVSILREGNTDLDEYRVMLEASNYYAIERVGGHLRTRYPLGVSLLAIPFVAIADVANPHPAGAPEAVTFSITHAEKIERFIASLVVAAAAVVVFLTASIELPPLPAFGLGAAFAFATSAWSMASRALWQHGPSMLLLAIALHLFVRARSNPSLAGWAGLPLSLAYVVRPTNAIPILVFTLLMAWKMPRILPRYVLCALPVAAALGWYSYATYGSLLPPYYSTGQIEGSPYFWTALAGHLVSPARGLFVYSPMFLLSIAGVALKLRRGTFDALDGALVAIAVLHWIMISAFPIWWAGHSYGPRYFSDVLPVFMYFLIPVVQSIRELGGRQRRLAVSGLVALCALGVAINAPGALTRRAWAWNVTPVSLDLAPERLWDFRDPPFLR